MMTYRKGAASLNIGGRRFDLVCDWSVIDGLQSDWGVEAYQAKLSAILTTMEIDGLCDVLSRMTGVPADEIKKASPALNDVQDAITRAWACAWIAPDQFDKALKEEAREEKKRRPTLWRKLSGMHSGQGSTGTGSGPSHHGKHA